MYRRKPVLGRLVLWSGGGRWGCPDDERALGNSCPEGLRVRPCIWVMHRAKRNRQSDLSVCVVVPRRLAGLTNGQKKNSSLPCSLYRYLKCCGGCWCWRWLSPGHMVSWHTRRRACCACARLGGAALGWPHSVCLSGSANAFAGASLCGTRSPMRQTSACPRSLQLRGGGAMGAFMAETSTGKVEKK